MMITADDIDIAIELVGGDDRAADDAVLELLAAFDDPPVGSVVGSAPADHQPQL